MAACIGPASIGQAIDANLADPTLCPDLLAKRFGLSWAALYRLFEPLGGVRSYIQQGRLSHSERL